MPIGIGQMKRIILYCLFLFLSNITITSANNVVKVNSFNINDGYTDWIDWYSRDFTDFFSIDLEGIGNNFCFESIVQLYKNDNQGNPYSGAVVTFNTMSSIQAYPGSLVAGMGNILTIYAIENKPAAGKFKIKLVSQAFCKYGAQNFNVIKGPKN